MQQFSVFQSTHISHAYTTPDGELTVLG